MLIRSSALETRVFSDRNEAGVTGAAIAAGIIRAEIARHGKAGVVFASAVSQDPFLAAVRVRDDIDWRRITSFHLDEYAGMTDQHPASFRRFQRERLLDHVPMGEFVPLNAEAADPVTWTKPDDLPYDPKKDLPKLGLKTADTFQAVLADGSVRSLSKKIDAAVLRGLITRDGGENVRVPD